MCLLHSLSESRHCAYMIFWKLNLDFSPLRQGPKAMCQPLDNKTIALFAEFIVGKNVH